MASGGRKPNTPGNAKATPGTALVEALRHRPGVSEFDRQQSNNNRKCVMNWIKKLFGSFGSRATPSGRPEALQSTNASASESVQPRGVAASPPEQQSANASASEHRPVAAARATSQPFWPDSVNLDGKPVLPILYALKGNSLPTLDDIRYMICNGSEPLKRGQSYNTIRLQFEHVYESATKRNSSPEAGDIVAELFSHAVSMSKQIGTELGGNIKATILFSNQKDGVSMWLLAIELADKPTPQTASRPGEGKVTGTTPSQPHSTQNLVPRLQSLKAKIVELQQADGPFAAVPAQAASKSQQQVQIIVRVIDDAVRACKSGRDINGRPISPEQIAAGICRLVSETRKPQLMMTLMVTMSNDAMRKLASYMDELETIAEDIR